MTDIYELPVFTDVPRELYDQGACRNRGTSVFFSGSKQSRLEAKAICAQCPVFEICESFATVTNQHGFWAGRYRPDEVTTKDLAVRQCTICDIFFEYQRKPGRPPATCSPACHQRAVAQHKRDYAERNNPAFGTNLKRGHGTINHYQTYKCRCGACKKAAREYRALMRANAKQREEELHQ